MMIGGGNRNCILAIVLLAKLTAVLARDANRIFALLRIACVIKYPGFYRAMLFDGRQSQVPNFLQNSGVGHKVSACRSR
jgi:hypothetical protein